MPASDHERCGQFRDLFRLRADAGRILNERITHEQLATAATGCAAAGLAPVI